MDEYSARLAALGCLRQAYFLRIQLAEDLAVNSSRIAHIASAHCNGEGIRAALDRLNGDVSHSAHCRDEHSKIVEKIEIIKAQRKAGQSHG